MVDDCDRIKRIGTFLLLSLILFVFLHRLWLERSISMPPVLMKTAFLEPPAVLFADPLLRSLQDYQSRLKRKMPLEAPLEQQKMDLEYFFDS